MNIFHSMFRDGKLSKKEVKKILKDTKALSKLGLQLEYIELTYRIWAIEDLVADSDENENDDRTISLEEFLQYSPPGTVA